MPWNILLGLTRTREQRASEFYHRPRAATMAATTQSASSSHHKTADLSGDRGRGLVYSPARLVASFVSSTAAGTASTARLDLLRLALARWRWALVAHQRIERCAARMELSRVRSAVAHWRHFARVRAHARGTVSVVTAWRNETYGQSKERRKYMYPSTLDVCRFVFWGPNFGVYRISKISAPSPSFPFSSQKFSHSTAPRATHGRPGVAPLRAPARWPPCTRAPPPRTLCTSSARVCARGRSSCVAASTCACWAPPSLRGAITALCNVRGPCVSCACKRPEYGMSV
jgi:hypothetical protein